MIRSVKVNNPLPSSGSKIKKKKGNKSFGSRRFIPITSSFFFFPFYRLHFSVLTQQAQCLEGVGASQVARVLIARPLSIDTTLLDFLRVSFLYIFGLFSVSSLLFRALLPFHPKKNSQTSSKFRDAQLSLYAHSVVKGSSYSES